jgi:radical SAM protein with 4Fe4S-binding SPASM domain
MCAKTEAELNEREKEFYTKLAAQGIMEPGQGSIPEERSQSALGHLDMEISSICNLQCKHCAATNNGKLMDFQLFLRVMEEAKKLGAISVSFNGGEPLLHPKLVEMIKVARSYPFRADLFTNGVLITKPFCEQIAALGLDKAHVSLDGLEEQHEQVRGKGAFEKTVQGIRLLREHGIRVWVSSILHQGNEGDAEKFQKFCMEDLKVNGLDFTPVNPIGNALENIAMFQYPQKTRDMLLPDRPNVLEDHPLRRTDMIRCRAAVGTLYITVEGDVYPCTYFSHPSFHLGSLQKNTLGEVYRGHLQKDSIFTKFDESELKECKDCPMFYSCAGGCRARAFLFTGNVYGKDLLACATRGFIQKFP